MSFILKMAWRDSRASRRRLALVAGSVVLGIAALVGIGSVGDSLQRTVEQQTKTLVGADLTVTARQKFSAGALAYFGTVGGERAQEVSFTTMINFPTHDDRRRLVQVRALTGAFPFYGDVVTAPADAMAKLAAGPGAILEETLLVQFGLRVGDPVTIGAGTFTVIGSLKKIPGESAAVAMFSPRVYLSPASLERTGLLARPALVMYREHFKLPPGRDAEAVAAAMKAALPLERLGTTTVAERKRDLGQNLQDVTAFLGLVGYVALFLGAVGVASAMHVYVRGKLATVAVLRCLGASARTSFAIYLVQGVGVGALGAVAGAALGVGVQFLLPVLLKDMLPFPVEVYLSWPAIAKGALAGLVICVLFTLLPLLAVRRVSPLLALRSALGLDGRKRDPWTWALVGLIAVAVTAFAILQAGRVRTGLGFAVAMAVGFGVLAGLARVVAWAAKRFTPRRGLPYVWRQGMANLHRPNNRTVLLLLALGLGTFLMLTLLLTRETLVAKIAAIGGGSRPNLMFFDIQDDQVAPLKKIVRESGARLVAEAPIVTMRLTEMQGKSVEALLKDDKSGLPGWALRREYRSTYRGELTDTEKVTAGTFTGHVAAGEARVPVSVEEGLAKELHLKLGDDLVFDVQGVPLTVTVGSLRQVEWQRLQPNFFVVFPDGVLEPAPKTFVAAVRTATTEQSARLQQAVGRELPSVSAIDLALILETFDSIFAKVAYVITFMAGFTVLTGVIVLVGAILSGRFQRIRETVLLRTLGATRRQLVGIQLVEYAVLGALAAATGGLLALGANALLARFVFKAAAVAPAGVLLAALAGAVAVTLLAGLFGNRGITDHPPLEVLRQET